jgi:hypothetical protein
VRRLSILALVAGCVPTGAPTDHTALDADFAERLTDRYTCGLDWYVAFDEDRTIRLQTGFGSRYDPEQPLEATFDLPPIDGEAEFAVYTGECLWTPGCTDDISVSCSQEIAQKFTGSSGRVSLVEAGDGSVSGSVSDLVRVGADEEDPIEVPVLDLPRAELWQEDTGD